MVHADDELLRRLAVFDVVINNADRKGGHILGSGGRVFGVDHGVCFHTDPKLRTLLWGWAGAELTEDELVAVKRVHDDVPGQLGELLAEVEMESLVGRAESLLTRGRFPRPRGTLAVDPLAPLLNLGPLVRLKRSRLRPSASIVDADISHAGRTLVDHGSTPRRQSTAAFETLDTRGPPLELPDARLVRARGAAASIPSSPTQARPSTPLGASSGGVAAGVWSGPDVRLRHHPVRRNPPRAREHLRGVRSAQPDLARRGPGVDYVQNVTDVDDPLLERAAADRSRLATARCRPDRAVHARTWPR